MQKNPIFIFIGRGGSGKTTQMSQLEKLGYKRLVTVTTREKRSGETEGKDYYFYDQKRFWEDDDVVLKSRSQSICYGISLNKLHELLDTSEHNIVCLNTQGIKFLEQYLGAENTKIIYLDVNRQESIKRMQKRGQPLEYIAKRVRADDGMLSNKDLQSLKSQIFKVNGKQSPEKILFEVMNIIKNAENQKILQCPRSQLARDLR